jgi:hypothetical protein
MGIPLSSIGIKISYAVETTKNTRPIAGYKHIPDLKSIPSFNPAPNTADATTFDNTEYTSYVQLLKDIGGALEITANFTQDLFDIWDNMVDEYETAVATGLRTWICFDIPNFDKAVFVPVQPARMGVPEASANSLLETTVFITPIGEPKFETAPTYAGTTLLGN